MNLRKTKKDDSFEGIAQIYVESWRWAYQNIVPDSFLAELTPAPWASLLQDETFDSFVLLDHARYIGAASFCSARDATLPDWGEIVSLYLLPDYAERGLGALLLDQTLSAMKDQGFEHIYLWVLEENYRARRFYEKHGFVNSGDVMSLEIGGKALTELRYTLHLTPASL